MLVQADPGSGELLPKRRRVSGCVFLALMCGGVLFLCSGQGYLPILSTGNRYDAGDVARRFAEAMRLNDAYLAKALVVEGQQPRIDEWINTHTTLFSCPVEWNFWSDIFWDGEGSWSSGFSLTRDPTTANWSVGYNCSRGGNYSFLVDEITLKQTGREWIITNWKKVCESRERDTDRCK
ncbi:MAG: hypothetical protein U0559_09730 [Anaerolineae bacterium]